MSAVRDNLHNYPIVAEPVPSSWPTIRVALVSCGKTKLPHPAPARDLYTGSLFRAARAYVEQANYDAWYILSARYGLVRPEQIIEPYEATMEGKDRDTLHAWIGKVDSAFRCSNPGYGKWSAKGGRLALDIFAGAAYAEPLVAQWADLSWAIDVPHRGLQIGERLAAFKAPTAGAQTPALALGGAA